ncbi:unnamed protein product [Rotaria socialis]|uniref:ADP ribosyltransferase domain-containing protein n=2 Tax=Rotaria socialis TaxID=392032 RepID=A0A820ZGS4_9BILA|nr:unnamed protein product [Rotaria socialis]
MGNKSLTSKVAKLPASTDKYINSYENDNKESTTLLWFDPNFESRRDIEQTAQRLRLINDYIKFYTDLDQCVKFIRLIDREKIFLITCGSKTSELLSHVSCLRQVNSIFIYCTKKQSYEHSKIIDSYTNLDELCDAIQNRIDLFDHQLQTFSFFDQNKQSTRDLSKDSGEFIWFQLFNHVIARFPRIEEAKQEMIEMCRQYYHGNSKELTLINQFESDYESEEAIYCDLSECLRREHKKILLSNEEFFTVYRGGKLDIEEFNKLKENQGKLISMNGYLSTSRRRPQTHDIATKLVKRTDVVSVLFQIEVHIKQIGNSVNFADITQFSEYPNGKEVLFDLNTCFKIESIEQDGSIELIRMKLSNPGEMITKDYIELTLRETEEKSVAIVFGRLMCNLGQYDKSQHYFEQLRKDPNGENLAWIEFNIGRVLCYKGEWKEARDHFDCAYDRMVANKPVRVKDSTRVLDKIGLILENQGKYDEALGYYKQALDIKEKCYLPGSVSIAASFNHIGNILSSQKKYNEALDFYKRALDIEGKCFSSGHVNIAANHNKIGIILRGQGRYDEALKYYQRALEMQEEHYPSGHADIAHSLSNIGHILFDQAKYDEALDYYQRALKMREKYYPSCDIAIVQSLNNIGGLLFEHEKYDEALDYYKRLLKIQEDYYSSDELDIAQSFNKLGKILYHQQRYDTALHYHQRALKIQVKHYSSDHVDIATSLNNIAAIFSHQEKYDEALDYYQQVLKMREKCYPSGHADIGQSLYNIGTVLEHQEKYNEALDYYRQALQLQGKHQPSDHIEIARSLNSIGLILEKQVKYDEALDYYQRSLKIQEESYPFGHVYVARNLTSIGDILYHQRNYDDALDYYQRSLKMQEEYYRSGHVEIAKSLYSIGTIFYDQEKYDEALDYFQRALKMREKYCSSDHVNIGESLNIIGICYEKQNKTKIALDYYHRPMTIFMKFLPPDHPSRIRIEERIHRLTKKK